MKLLLLGGLALVVGVPGSLLAFAAWSDPALPSQPVRDHVFHDVTLVEPGHARTPHVTIELKDGRIAKVGAASAGSGDEAFVGHFALPGLIDVHIHHLPRFSFGSRDLFALLFLAHGVTSVRDTGSLWGSALGMARHGDGAVASPRIFSCGAFLTGNNPAPIGMRLVENEASANQAVKELKASGADCIKIRNGLSRESVLALVAKARALDLPVVGHVPAASSLAAMGGSEVQHLMKVSPSWSRVRHDAVKRYVEVSKAEGIRHTPTLVVFDEIARRSRGNAETPDARWLPRYIREVLWNGDINPAVRVLEASAGSPPSNRIELMKLTVRSLALAGVPLQVGTDTPNPGVVPGAAVHRELELLVESGLTLEQAWIAGTRAGGRALGVDKLGTLAAGAPADLLLFREDPTRDLAALETLEAVVVGGRLYRKSELEAALERQREHFEGSLYDRLSVFLTRQALGLIGL